MNFRQQRYLSLQNTNKCWQKIALPSLKGEEPEDDSK